MRTMNHLRPLLAIIGENPDHGDAWGHFSDPVEFRSLLSEDGGV